MSERIKEIEIQWYKDPTLLVSPSDAVKQAKTDIEFLLSTIKSLQTERDRYREALKRIEDIDGDARALHAVDIAQSALREKPESE